PVLFSFPGPPSPEISTLSLHDALPIFERITVTLRHSKIHAEDCAECETKVGLIDQLEREIHLDGALDDEQRRKLMEIADKCPVRSEEHTSELQSHLNLVCRLLLEKKQGHARHLLRLNHSPLARQRARVCNEPGGYCLRDCRC